MLAISLWQIWATLVSIGAKKYETRHWPTPYRGPLIIHAAKKWNHELYSLALMDPFAKCLREGGYNVSGGYDAKGNGLPLGAFLCVVDLVEIVRTEDVVNSLSEQEVSFGNYLPGRFAWKLDNVRIFPEPVPARGYQGLWNPLEGADPAMARLINGLYKSPNSTT